MPEAFCKARLAFTPCATAVSTSSGCAHNPALPGVQVEDKEAVFIHFRKDLTTVLSCLSTNMLAGEHTPAADMMSNQAAQPTPKDSSAAACDNTREKFRLGDTPEDILRLVLSELLATSPNAVLNLARSSKTLHHAALPFVYRSVVLDRQGSNKRRSYQALITKFRSDGDRGLARHVRRLTVQDDIPPEDLMLILNKIDQCGKLYEFE